MGAIHVLPPRIAELIAAGEVIDRPASIVKELVENSLDAGAKRITVEIKNGGVTYLCVTDNGCGIECDDIPTAFIRHATSKISSENDLDAINTLGFRGEALPSVAAVSHVKLITRTADNPIGYIFEIDASQSGTIEETACTVGTSIEVIDLFYNTPARMKFLKKDVAEGNAVSVLLENLALANPSVSFALMRENKRVLFTPGDGELLSVIRIIYGSDVASAMIPVYINRENIIVSGYISKPSLSRATRSQQTFFINTRYIRSRTCLSAVEEAYKNRLLTGRYPSCVINLEINSQIIDVNVHPAKMEVRFSNERDIFNAVYSSCKIALEKNEEKPTEASISHVTPFSVTDFDHTAAQTRLTGNNTVNSYSAPQPMVMKDDTDIITTFFSKESVKFKNEDNTEEVFSLNKKFIDIEVDEKPPALSTETSSEKVYQTPGKITETEIVKNEPVNFRVIGELFELYILIESEDKFLLIDKHAAHERYIYDKIRQIDITKERQVLLTPQSVTLPREEYFAIVNNAEALEKLGIIAEDFGGCTILVREIPMLLESCPLTLLLSEVASRIIDSNYDITPPIIDRMLYSMSCRAAIMGGKSSPVPELEALAETVLNEEKIRYCPHGRPAVVAMSKYEIERLFGRIK